MEEFSSQRALGITKAERSIATVAGIPATESGCKRKAKSTFCGGCLADRLRQRCCGMIPPPGPVRASRAGSNSQSTGHYRLSIDPCQRAFEYILT